MASESSPANDDADANADADLELDLTIHEKKDLNESKTYEAMNWQCKSCKKDCFPITDQSWCLCGHRYRMHSTNKHFACTANCECPSFYYIVAQGSWKLRCRCKHKDTDHDRSGVGGKYRCKKAKCSCENFYSPWICNCNHGWGDHTQFIVTCKVKNMAEHLHKYLDQSVARSKPGATTTPFISNPSTTSATLSTTLSTTLSATPDNISTSSITSPTPFSNS